MKKNLFVGIAVVAFALSSCKKSENTENMSTDSSMTGTTDSMMVSPDTMAAPNADSINTTVMPDATGTGTGTTTDADSAR